MCRQVLTSCTKDLILNFVRYTMRWCVRCLCQVNDLQSTSIANKSYSVRYMPNFVVMFFYESSHLCPIFFVISRMRSVCIYLVHESNCKQWQKKRNEVNWKHPPYIQMTFLKLLAGLIKLSKLNFIKEKI